MAIIETKNRAMHLTTKLEQELDFPQPVRIHWTGCPNSCGQAQVADIGLMGAPAKKDGKAVEGVRIFTGGKVGENPELAKQLVAGVPLDEEGTHRTSKHQKQVALHEGSQKVHKPEKTFNHTKLRMKSIEVHQVQRFPKDHRVSLQ